MYYLQASIFVEPALLQLKTSLSRLTFAYTEYEALTIYSLLRLAPPHNHAHTKMHFYAHENVKQNIFMRIKMFSLAFYRAFLCNKHRT